MQPSGRGYDHRFPSLDGRLYQVEYTGICEEGDNNCRSEVQGRRIDRRQRISSKLIIIDSIEKMYKIDDHIGFTTSGLIADARQLVTGRGSNAR